MLKIELCIKIFAGEFDGKRDSCVIASMACFSGRLQHLGTPEC